ncbi:augmin complex subunit dgt6 [Anopheles aquasalis]|uniref:augmin complex subunit dgt6 n=1 Tax=Anopheles aquasalis TaxID=42839 RepID=UPI00215A1BCC|nr:augmin complex subunit dgt6 [Anopheles aquasalis]
MHKKQHSTKANTSQQQVTAGGYGGVPATASECEKQLDAAIFRGLHALTKRHEPSDEFRGVFVRGAFLKPNTKAFIQVLHFLLNVYDAREFKKRFIWPIYDKSIENAFRSATVTYVNHLIETGKLTGMGKIKAHVVVLPGGVKFMKFLLGLTRFVLQEELARVRPTAPAYQPLTRNRLAELATRHRHLSETRDRLCAIMQEEVKSLYERTRKNRTLLANILSKSDPAQAISYEELMGAWIDLIESQRLEQEQKRDHVLSLSKQFDKLTQQATRLLKENEHGLSFSKEQLKDVITKLQLNRPSSLPEPVDRSSALEVFDEKGKVNPVELFKYFGNLLPEIESCFANFSSKDHATVEFEYKELSRVTLRLTQVRQEIDYLSRTLPCLRYNLTAAPGEPQSQQESSPETMIDNYTIKSKLFCTPPIAMNFEGTADQRGPGMASRGIVRLALLDKDDVHAMNARLKQLSISIAPSIRSPRRGAAAGAATSHLATSSSVTSQTEDGSNTLKVFAVPGRTLRKEKLDPLTMLNRIKAQSHKQQQQDAASGAANSSLMNFSTISDMTLRPEFSSTMLGTPEKVASKPPSNKVGKQSQPFGVPSPANLPGGSPRLRALYAGSTTPKSALTSRFLMTGIGPAARRSHDGSNATGAHVPGTSIKKRSSLIVQETIQTSPSGRLGSIVAHGDPLPSTPANILITVSEVIDLTIDGSGTEDEQTLSPENGGQLVDLSHTLLANTAIEQQPSEGQVPVLQSQEVLQTIMNNDPEMSQEDLFNISDGIVTDFE